MTGVPGLARLLDLELSPDGTPVNPFVLLDLDEWRDAPATAVTAAASAVAAALPVTTGVLRGPAPPSLARLIGALSLTLTDAPVPPPPSPSPSPSVSPSPSPSPWPMPDISGNRPPTVSAGSLPGQPTLDEAVARLREAVEYSPRAAVACGRLLRQTAALDTTGGLAAEAAAYSLLLGGPEFARWLAARGPGRRTGPPADPVLVDRAGNRLVITLNVPERRNAFSAAMREALLDALLLAEADPAIESVELRGAGPSFCSGGDIGEFGTAKDLVAAYLVRLSRAPWRVIDRIAPKVTVMAHGACVGAGTEMLAYAGRVIAAPNAFFQLPEVRMGLVPGADGSVSVTRRIGRHRAAWLMLTGERLPARTALAWGLADEAQHGN